MISGLLIFLEVFLFIIKWLLLHQNMLLASTSTAKRFCPSNGRKTSSRASTTPYMMSGTDGWAPIIWSTVLVRRLKNRLKSFILAISWVILTIHEGVANIVSANRSLQTILSSCYSSWWDHLVLDLSRRFWRWGFLKFAVRWTLCIILRSVRSLTYLSKLKIFLHQSICPPVGRIYWHGC